MKKYLMLGIVLGLMLFAIKPAAAQGKGFGMGIILGEPTGLSAKLWTSGDNAFDFAAAWSVRGEGNLLLQADYVWHFFNVIPVSSGKLPLYIGIGGRVVLANDPQLGVRIPFGMDYLFADAPVDIFVELVPILDLSPATNFGVGGGIGVRYWF